MHQDEHALQGVHKLHKSFNTFVFPVLLAQVMCDINALKICTLWHCNVCIVSSGILFVCIRYDLLCLEGLSRGLQVFLKKYVAVYNKVLTLSVVYLRLISLSLKCKAKLVLRKMEQEP